MPSQLVALDDKQDVLIKYSNSDPLGYHQGNCILNPWLLYIYRYASPEDMVPYKQGVGSASGNYMQVFATAPSVGTSHDWTTASFFSQRSYAVQADLETSK